MQRKARCLALAEALSNFLRFFLFVPSFLFFAVKLGYVGRHYGGGFPSSPHSPNAELLTSQSLPLRHVTLYGLTALVYSSITHVNVFARVTLPLSVRTVNHYDERRFYNYPDGMLRASQF